MRDKLSAEDKLEEMSKNLITKLNYDALDINNIISNTDKNTYKNKLNKKFIIAALVIIAVLIIPVSAYEINPSLINSFPNLFNSLLFGSFKTMDENGKIDKVFASCENNGVKFQVPYLAMDDEMIILNLRVSGDNYLELDKTQHEKALDVYLTDKNGKRYDVTSLGYMGVNEKKQGYREYKAEFRGSPKQDTDFTLTIESTGSFKGKWEMSFNATYITPQFYTMNIPVEWDDNYWVFNKLKVSATGMVLEATVEKANEDLMFELSDGKDKSDGHPVGDNHTQKISFSELDLNSNLTLSIYSDKGGERMKLKKVININKEDLVPVE